MATKRPGTPSLVRGRTVGRAARGDPRLRRLRHRALVAVQASAASLARLHAQELAELIFLLVPFWVVEHRHGNIEDYGFHLHHAWRAIALASSPCSSLPAFIIGFEWWWCRRTVLAARLPATSGTSPAQFLVVALPRRPCSAATCRRGSNAVPLRPWHGIRSAGHPLTSAPSPSSISSSSPRRPASPSSSPPRLRPAPPLERLAGPPDPLPRRVQRPGDALYFGYMT